MRWRIFRKNVPTSNAHQSCIASLNLCSRFAIYPQGSFKNVLYNGNYEVRNRLATSNQICSKDNLIIFFHTHRGYSWKFLLKKTFSHYNYFNAQKPIKFSIFFNSFFVSIRFDKGENKKSCATSHKSHDVKACKA